MNKFSTIESKLTELIHSTGISEELFKVATEYIAHGEYALAYQEIVSVVIENAIPKNAHLFELASAIEILMQPDLEETMLGYLQ